LFLLNLFHIKDGDVGAAVLFLLRRCYLMLESGVFARPAWEGANSGGKNAISLISAAASYGKQFSSLFEMLSP